MKLKELLEELHEKGFLDKELRIFGKNLETFRGSLMLCDEFKNVKQLNILEQPNYMTNDNGDPDPYGEIVMPTYVWNIHDGSSLLNKASEVFDIYEIQFSLKQFDEKDLDSISEGVFILPVSFNSGFTSIHEIRIKFTRESLQDNHLLVDKILDEVKLNLLNDIESNVPFRRDIMIRVSPRSLKQ